MFVIPAPGRAVRDPEMNHALLPATGRDVPRNEYWLRRLSAEDVLEHDPNAVPGTAGERPDDADPGVQVDGQGLPPAVTMGSAG